MAPAGLLFIRAKFMNGNRQLTVFMRQVPLYFSNHCGPTKSLQLRETLSSPNSPPLVSWAGGEDLYIEPSIFWDDTLELCVVFVAILFYGLNLGSIPNYSNKRMWSQYDKWCLNHPQHQGAEAPVRFKHLFGVRLQGQ